MNEIVGAVPLCDRRCFRAGMQLQFGKLLLDSCDSGDVVFMAVRDEEVPQLKLVLGDEGESWLRVPAGIKHRRFARDFIPDEISIHGDTSTRRCERAKLAPSAEILF